MRAFSLVLACLSCVLAQPPEPLDRSVQVEVRKIVRWQQAEIQRRTGGIMEIDPNTGKSPVVAEIEAEVKRRLERLIKEHGPGGSGERKNVSSAWTALQSLSPFGPSAEAKRIAGRVLLEDPNSEAAWGVLRHLYSARPWWQFFRDGMDTTSKEGLVPTPDPTLVAWTLRLVVDRSNDDTTQAARALRLFTASLGLGRGHPEYARGAVAHFEDGPMNAVLEQALRELYQFIEKKTGPPAPELPWTEVTTLARRATDREGGVVRLLAAARALGPDVIRQFALAGIGDAADDTPRPADLRGALLWTHARLDREVGQKSWKELSRQLRDRAPEKRLAFTWALFELRLDGDVVRAALENTARSSRDWRVVATALRALQHHDTEASPRKLLGRRKHKRWQIRLALSEALQGYRHVDAVDGLLDLLVDDRLRIRVAAARGLHHLTGRNFGDSAKAWRQWRRERPADWTVPSRDEARARRGAEPPGGHQYASRKRVRWYGIDIPSDRVVFVLDKSQSMYHGLWAGAVREVAKWLEGAGKRTSYGVVEFADVAKTWKPRVMPADPRTVRSTVKFLAATRPDGRTNIIDGLRSSLTIKDADSAVLLSDGLPNVGAPHDPNGIIETFTKENRHLRLQTHTVQLLVFRRVPHDAPPGAEDAPPTKAEQAHMDQMRAFAMTSELGRFLRELAARNDGTYGVAFGAMRLPPPGAATGPAVDR